MSQIRSMTRAEAEAELSSLVGWPAARIIERPEYGDYIIIAHAVGCDCGRCPVGCDCGRCPVLHDSGEMK